MEILTNMAQERKNKDDPKTTKPTDKTNDSSKLDPKGKQRTPKKDFVKPNEVIELSPADKLQIEKNERLIQVRYPSWHPIHKGLNIDLYELKLSMNDKKYQEISFQSFEEKKQTYKKNTY